MSYLKVLANQQIEGVLPPANLPLATSGAVGGVQVDGTTITVNGSGVISVAAGASGLSCAVVNLAPSGPGNFTVAHGLAVVPTAVAVQTTSGIAIWLNNATPWDGTNVYLTASAAGTGKAYVFYEGGGSTVTPSNVSVTATGPGLFQVPHHLGAAPTAVVIQMTSGTAIWLQEATPWDATYIYLDAAAAGNAIAVCFT